MLYAFRDGDELYIVAADTVDEFERSRDAILARGGFTLDVVDVLSDPRLQNLTTMPVVMSHATDAERDEFIARFDIVLKSVEDAQARHVRMYPDPIYEAVAKVTASEGDLRPIGEIYGTNAMKPTAPTQDADAANKQQRREGGALTGDSFAAPTDKSYRITDIKQRVDEHGNVTVESANVVKLDKDKPRPTMLDASTERTLPATPEEDAQRRENCLLGQTIEPGNFYFAVIYGEVSQTTVVALVSKPFFVASNHGYYEEEVSYAVNDLLAPLMPEGSVPFHHGMFVFDGSTAQARAEMRRRGLEWNPAFQSAVMEYFGFDMGGASADEIAQEIGVHYPYRAKDFTYGLTRDDGQKLTIVSFKSRGYQPPDSRFPIWVEDFITPVMADILPKGFVEEAPGAFVYVLPEDRARTALNDAGFEEDPALTQWIENRLFNTDPNNPNDSRTDIPGTAKLYWRVDVEGIKVDEVRIVLQNTDDSFDLDAALAVARNVRDGSWFAFAREVRARVFADILAQAGIELEEPYAVTPAGNRIIEKGAGARVVDKTKEVVKQPRPWNDMAALWHASEGEAREALRKGMSGKEFYFTGRDAGDGEVGSIIFITPASYFNENDDVWKESLDIAHLLPQDVYEIRPGVYRSKSRYWHDLAYDLERRGLVENMLFQMHLNFDS